MKAYYNEIEPFAAAWLKELIAKGQLPDGDIDTRSIEDVQPGDLAGYSDCHFFAGIGGWAYALRLAGVEGRGIWTGSCPCQPFSVAGKGKGTDDERHLWPEFYRLIGQCQPAKVFGEQVASPLGRSWLASVFADLEDVGYAVAGADMCAAGVGAPHIRQRLWWVAHAAGGFKRDAHAGVVREEGSGGAAVDAIGGSKFGGVAHAGHDARSAWRTRGIDQPEPSIRARPASGSRVGDSPRGEQRRDRLSGESGRREGSLGGPSAGGRLGDAIGPRLEGHAGDGDRGGEPGRHEAESGGPVAEAGGNGVWARADYIECLDGKARPVEPGIFPVANGFPGRVGTLRGSGNAIVPQVAEVFVRAALEAV